MSNFAPVAPLDVAKRLEQEGELGTYQLLLAHQVLADPEEHRRFWLPKMDQFIIMDNSLIELKNPLPVDLVMEAADIVGADVIVLPDVLGDRHKTYKLFGGALNQFQATDGSYKFKTLGVAQGIDAEDTFQCGRDMAKAGVDMISVPRRLTSVVGTRINAVRLLSKLGKPLHLLGFSTNLWDDVYCTTLPGVRGIDSAVPIWFGATEDGYLPLKPPTSLYTGSRPNDYDQWEGKSLPKRSIDNVRTVREWVSTAQGAHTEESQAPLIAKEM